MTTFYDLEIGDWYRPNIYKVFDNVIFKKTGKLLAKLYEIDAITQKVCTPIKNVPYAKGGYNQVMEVTKIDIPANNRCMIKVL